MRSVHGLVYISIFLLGLTRRYGWCQHALTQAYSQWVLCRSPILVFARFAVFNIVISTAILWNYHLVILSPRFYCLGSRARLCILCYSCWGHIVDSYSDQLKKPSCEVRCMLYS